MFNPLIGQKSSGTPEKRKKGNRGWQESPKKRAILAKKAKGRAWRESQKATVKLTLEPKSYV